MILRNFSKKVWNFFLKIEMFEYKLLLILRNFYKKVWNFFLKIEMFEYKLLLINELEMIQAEFVIWKFLNLFLFQYNCEF